MPKNAKIYIALIITLGLALLAGSLVFRAEFSDLPRYFSYLLLAVIASTLKVRLPGITGTISVNFLFILIGIADFTLAETLTMGCLAILTQCLWRTKSRPHAVQVAFNVAALSISIGTAYQVTHFAMALDHLYGDEAIDVAAMSKEFARLLIRSLAPTGSKRRPQGKEA